MAYECESFMTEKREWIWIILLVVVVLVIVPFGLFAILGGPCMGSGMMRGWGGMMTFGSAWPFMFLIPLVFVVLVGIYFLLSGQGRVVSSALPVESDALRILKERYARSEITSEQYTKMKRDLES